MQGVDKLETEEDRIKRLVKKAMEEIKIEKEQERIRNERENFRERVELEKRIQTAIKYEADSEKHRQFLRNNPEMELQWHKSEVERLEKKIANKK